MTQVTFTTKPAEPRSGQPRALRYEVLINLAVAGQPSLPVFTGWRNTRNIIAGPIQTRTFEFEAAKAVRMYRFLKMCLVDGARGYSPFTLVEIILDQGYVFGGGRQVEGTPTRLSSVAVGMPYTFVDKDNRATLGFVGLGPNLGLSYSPASLGAAIINLDQLAARNGYRGIWHVLGRAAQ